ncbi:MAG TPA: alpha-ketoglutarate-dependent dioxygenase AlkB [Candidatus Dormibacteraeota bacterium]|jgi:alkylated DNA repair dioxygenase AlkB|nr:alpha-ketoglutarate-dependent dioxygenase AlkB [Candidatus Dormibacteraeota bacterium]
MLFQPSLFATGGDSTPDVDESFSDLVRDQLDATAWLDHAPGWLTGSDDVFQWLLDTADWYEGEITIHGKRMIQPRLLASWPCGAGDPPVPPLLERIRTTLSSRYGEDFDSIHANLYRDGRDSVAWHGDRIARTVRDPLVAIVSLGEPRRLLLRRRGGRTERTLHLGHGDLLVMGGASQRTWQHTVPKAVSAGPRISVTLRHSRNRSC